MPTKNKTTNGSNSRARASGIGERLAKLETHREYFATKDDISNLRAAVSKLRAELENLRSEFTAHIKRQDVQIANIKENMATKADLQQSENRILRWNVASIVSVAALVIAIFKLFP